MTSKLFKIPRRFLEDHKERDLPTPALLRASALHYTISVDDPNLGELLEDARHYSDIVSMSGDSSLIGLQSGARATVKAIKAARAA